MAQNANRAIVPGNGRFWIGAVDSPPPGQLIKITGAPTSTSLVLIVGAVTAAAITVTPTTVDADCLEIAQTIANLSSVGSGRVSVLPADTTGYAYLVFIDPIVATQAITTTGTTFTAGSTPAVTVSTTASGLGAWTPYTEIGHTSQDSPLQVNRSGGDVTTLDSWQQAGIASSTAATQYSLAFSLLQYDIASMKLYYGSNANFAVNGMLQTAQANPAATEQALVLQVLNGSKAQWRHYPRVSIIAADGENFDTTKIAGMPVQAGILASSTYAFGQQLSQVGAAA